MENYQAGIAIFILLFGITNATLSVVFIAFAIAVLRRTKALFSQIEQEQKDFLAQVERARDMVASANKALGRQAVGRSVADEEELPGAMTTLAWWFRENTDDRPNSISEIAACIYKHFAPRVDIVIYPSPLGRFTAQIGEHSGDGINMYTAVGSTRNEALVLATFGWMADTHVLRRI